MTDVNLESLYRDYGTIVEARVCSILGESSQNVDDIVSEIFLDFTRFIKSGKFRGDSSPQTVLFTITNRRVADFIRHKVKENNNYLKSAREIAGKIDAKSEPIIHDFECRSLFTKIIDALDVLTEREKDVFWFHGVGEETVSDLTEKMGISESQINHLYDEAKKKLAVAIKDAVKGQASLLSDKEKSDWLDRFYYAYLKLGDKKGHLTDGIKLAAAQAHAAIRLGFVPGKDGKD